MVSRKVFFEDEMLLVPSAVFHFIDNLVMYNVIPCENQFYSFMRCSVTSLQLAQVLTSAVKVDQKDKVKRMTLKTANGLFKLWRSFSRVRMRSRGIVRRRGPVLLIQSKFYGSGEAVLQWCDF